MQIDLEARQQKIGLKWNSFPRVNGVSKDFSIPIFLKPLEELFLLEQVGNPLSE